ncbi:MAG: non-heme iron oxygenase ferredoxin subunit [Acetobacteraceae bacterium]
MQGLVRLIGTAEVPDGEGRRVQAAGGDYAVFNLGGVFYVTQNRCTHGPGDLGDCFVEGEEVECDFHQGRFHIPTGRPTAAPCTEPLRVWDVVVRDGAVWIDPAAGRVAA